MSGAMKGKSGSQAKSTTPPPAFSLSQPGILQRQCDCGGVAGLTGQCEECNSKRLSGQRGMTPPALPNNPPDDRATGQIQRSALPSRRESPLSGYSFGNLAIAPKERFGIQAKLAIGQPGDKYEQEADQVAEAVIQKLKQPVQAEEKQKDEEDTIQAKTVTEQITPLIQRQFELELEAEDEEEVTAPIQSSALFIQRQMEETEDEDELIQEKASTQPVTSSLIGITSVEPTDDRPGLQSQLQIAKTGGEYLPTDSRTSMEYAFGADFSTVRIHTDETAHNLSRSLNATAFTTENHIFFRKGTFNPDEQSGRRLLAHELTHVVQQNPNLSSDQSRSPSQAEVNPKVIEQLEVNSDDQEEDKIAGLSFLNPKAGVIQREAPKSETETKSQILIGKIYIFSKENNILLESPANANVRPNPGVYEAKISGSPGSYQISFASDSYKITREPPGLSSALKLATKILLVVYDPAKGLVKDQPEPPQQADVPSTGKQPGEEGEKPGEGGNKTEEKKSEESDQTPTDEKGEQTGTGKKAGSKYGWLGLLDLPSEVIKALEAALEILGDSEEFLALRDLLMTLSDLGTYANDLESLFTDTDRLISVALGIEDSPSINLLEKWVNKPAPKHKLAPKNSSTKGIIKVAKKVLALLEKVRRILKPIFKARAVFQQVLGLVASVFEEVEGLEELIELSKDQSGSPSFNNLLEYVSGEASKKIQEKLEGARKSFKLQKEQFLEAELVQMNELAAAVTQGLVMLVPKQYKPFVKIAQALGLDRLIAENLIAQIIPESALGTINDQFRKITKLLDEKFISTVETQLDELLKSTEAALQDQLIPELKNLLIQPDLKPGITHLQSSPISQALNYIQQSQGEPLDNKTRLNFEEHLGFNFANVRIHQDTPAQQANEILQANAFTMGKNIYFAPGQYMPNSFGGKRLLAHELTHVVQQSQSLQPGIIQRDLKTVREKMVKKFGSAALEGVVLAKRPGQDKKDRAEKVILPAVKKLIDNPAPPQLPSAVAEAYIYSFDKQGKPARIRRKVKWVGILPALSIKISNKKQRIIQLGFLSKFDPKNLDRQRLRRAMGCKTGEQAHHVIPLELRSNSLVKIAEKNGWAFNGQDNGRCISDLVHSGSHPNYTNRVTQSLTALQKKYPGVTDWTILEKPFRDMVTGFKSALAKRTTKLD